MPPWRAFAASAASAGGYGMLAYQFVGKRVLEAAGIAEPAWLASLMANRILCAGVFFGLSTASTALGKTGAFEVTLDGVSIWSKLATGAAPPLDALVAAIERAGVARRT